MGSPRKIQGMVGDKRLIRYIRNNKTISGRLHDEIVMMDPAQGKYFSLNPVATRIWELLDKWCGADEICEILRAEYDVDLTRCSLEVLDCLSSMTELGLILMQDGDIEEKAV